MNSPLAPNDVADMSASEGRPDLYRRLPLRARPLQGNGRSEASHFVQLLALPETGLFLAFTTPDQFSLTAGQGELRDYQFDKRVMHHLFCAACGIQSFARGTAPDGKEMVAINVRCLDGVDLATLTLTPIDGRSR